MFPQLSYANCLLIETHFSTYRGDTHTLCVCHCPIFPASLLDSAPEKQAFFYRATLNWHTAAVSLPLLLSSDRTCSFVVL